MLESGYVRDYRSVLSWEWYKDANTSRLFRHLVLTVNYEDCKWRGKVIKRGQRVTSYQQLSFELGISIQGIRTAIKHLKSTGEITYVGTRESSIITVNNYDNFQQPTCELTDNQQTTNRPLTDHQQLCNKDNKDKKDKKNIYSEIFSAYASNDSELLQALNDFAEMRKAIKKPLSTQRAAKMLLTSLDKLATDNKTKIAILNQSIFKSWQGVFPLKDNLANKQQANLDKDLTFDVDEYERATNPLYEK